MSFSISTASPGEQRLWNALTNFGSNTSQITFANQVLTIADYSPTLVGELADFLSNQGSYNLLPPGTNAASFNGAGGQNILNISTGSFSTSQQTNPFAVGSDGTPTLSDVLNDDNQFINESASGAYSAASAFVASLAHELGHFEDKIDNNNPYFSAPSGVGTAFQSLINGFNEFASEGAAIDSNYLVAEQIASNSAGSIVVPLLAGAPTFLGNVAFATAAFQSFGEINSLAVQNFAGDYFTAKPSSTMPANQQFETYTDQNFSVYNQWLTANDPTHALPLDALGATGASNIRSGSISYGLNQTTPTTTINWTNGTSTEFIFSSTGVTRTDYVTSTGVQTYTTTYTNPGLFSSNNALKAVQIVAGNKAFAPAQTNPDTFALSFAQLVASATSTTVTNSDGSVTQTWVNLSNQPIGSWTTNTDKSITLVVTNPATNTTSDIWNFASSDLTQFYTHEEFEPTSDILSRTTSVGLGGFTTSIAVNYGNGSSVYTDFAPADLAPGQLSVQKRYSGLGETGTLNSLYVTNADGSTDFTDNINQVVVHSLAGTISVTSAAPSDLGSEIGAAFASVLTEEIAPNNPLAQIVLGSVLSGVGSALGDQIESWFTQATQPNLNVGGAIGSGFQFLPSSVETAGAGEIAAFLVGQLTQAIGLKGDVGQLTNDVAGTFASQLVKNIVYQATLPVGEQPSSIFQGLNLNDPNFDGLVGVAIGSFLGAKLASLVVSPSTSGGEIGEQLGSALGGLAATLALGSEVGGVIAGEVGVTLGIGTLGGYIAVGLAFGVIGAFVGVVVGTLIGDLFGEAPSPQAYADINIGQSSTGHYFTANFRSSKDNGPISTVMSIANAITSELNVIVEESGGTLGNANQLPGSVVGIRRGVAEDINNTGDHKFYGNTGVQQLINFSVLTQLANLQIVGGNVYVKRAISAVAANAFDASGNPAVDSNAVAGAIQIAQDYQKYLSEEVEINAIIAGAPQSALSLGWATELAEAAALGLDKRGISDWNAGWNGFLQSQTVDPLQVTFNLGGNERLITAGSTVVDDTIDSTDKTIIQGDNSAAQTITVLDNTLQLTNTGTITANGAPVTAPVTIPIAAMIYGGNGAGDVIWAGNEGNDVFGGNGGTAAAPDTIYGYSSATDKTAAATWIYGGSGANDIVAGASSGDYLKGGAGNDTVNASLTTSAWIDGGTGNNSLVGGKGDDVITAEGGSASAVYSDIMTGGGGTDTYIVDPYTSDTINNAPASGQAPGGGTIELEGNIAFSRIGMSTVSGSGTNTNLVIDVYAAGKTGSTIAGGYTQVVASNSVVETITIQNWSVLADRVQYLESYDPQTKTSQTIDIGNFAKIVVGTPGSDFLQGSQNADAIFGMGGIDTIEGFGGNNLINGDGFLDGGTGSDTIFGGSKADTLLGGGGSNALEGAAGNDLILGGAFDTVAADSDTIQGGPGNDTLIGGPDHNLFEYAAGDGSDLLVSGLSTAAWIPVWLSSTQFQADFARDTVSGEITLTVALDGMAAGTPIYYTQQTTVAGAVIPAGTMNGIVDVEDSISSQTGGAVSGIYWQPYLTQSAQTQTASNPNDTLEFGPSITASELLFLHPAGSNDLLIGINDGNITSAATPGSFAELTDQIRIENYFSSGAIGSVVFESASGSLTSIKLATTNLLGPSIDGGAQVVSVSNTATTQAYWITGAAPNDTLASGAGDTLIGGAGNDTITGGTGNNLLIGHLGNDDLVAGSSGVDTLDGGPGADTLVGSGQTWASYADATAGLTANLGNAANTQKAGTQSAHAQVRTVGHGDVAQFLFGLLDSSKNAHKVGRPQLVPAVTYANTGDAASDIYTNITGLIGSKFNDTLVASAAGSSLDGGGGSDLLVGGTGADDFVYNVAPTGALAYGSDTILLGGGSDTLDLYNPGGVGINFDNLGFTSANGTLVITDGSAHTVTVLGLTSAGQTLTINLDGDTSVTFSGLPVSGNAGFAVASGVGATVNGGTTPTLLVGSTGNDKLTGQSGNDTFEGGAGADTITGVSVSGVATNTASYAGSSAGVTITLNNAAATGIGGDAQGDVLTDIQNLVGSAYKDSLTGDANANLIDGGAGNDTIIGGGGNDTLIGSGVDYIVSTGLGNSLISEAGCTITGQGSTLIAGDGNGTVYGGAGNDQLSDQGGYSSSLDGGAGNDLLNGWGNDTLDGGGGNDTIYAHTGNSLLEDSNSNATLYGGTGLDTLFAGSGNNVLYASASANTVLISDEGSLGGTLMNGSVSASDTNTLNGSTMAGIAAGNDTFEFSALSGITVVNAENGINELQFDSSINYQDLWFKGSSPVLDIFLIGSTQPFEIEIPNFFYPGNNYAPSIADIVAGGKVLFLSQFNPTATAMQSLMREQANLWGNPGAPAALPGALANLLNEGYFWQPIATATDTLSGTGGPSLLRGTKYNNVITGYDTVVGTSDVMIAGGGTNLITELGNTGASIVGGAVSDTLIGGPGANTLLGGSGNESITGGTSADVITAGSGTDTINGLDGNDTITGGNGNYWIAGGGGADLISVGGGNDTIYGFEPSFTPNSGSDTDGANTIIAGGGNDLIYAGQDAVLSGGDSIQIGASAAPGNATIYGGTGYDTINLNGAALTSINQVFATGEDMIYLGSSADSITGKGNDTVWFDSVSSGVTINMLTNSFSGGAARDSIVGIDNIWGSPYADSIRANNDTLVMLHGGNGGDTLVAGSGNDLLQDTGNATLIGGSGTDSFNVISGTDQITGGSGNDDFFFYTSMGGTLSQGTRSVNGKQDAIALEAGVTGTLTINGPGIMPPATEVSTQISYLDNTPYYDLWFSRPQGTNNLVVTEFSSTGTQTQIDLVSWFTNPAIQDALNLQYFDAGTPLPPGLSNPAGNIMLASSSTGGLNITGLLQLEATVAAPTNSAQANALYTGAYATALDLDWKLNTPPTIAIQGSNTGTVYENINSGTASSTLSFTVSLGDAQTVAQNLIVKASGGSQVAASASLPNSSGVATITIISSQFIYGNEPISVTVTDGDGAQASTTYTLDVLAVDPPPVFVNGGVTGVSFNEGATATSYGALSPAVTFYVDDLTPSGTDDSGSLVITASSSNQALISNGNIGIATVSGYPTERMLTMYSQPNTHGSSWITLTASDGSKSATETFLATVNQVEIPPVISNVGTQTYYESTSSQTETIAFNVTGANGITPSVSDAVGANSWWIHPGSILNYGGGNYGAVITIDPGSWTTGAPGTTGGWTGSLVITASDGTDSPQESVPISSVWQHLPFSLPPSQSFTIAENGGVSPLTGFGSIGPIGNSNSDVFTYAIVSGNTDGGAIGVASGNGLVYDNGISWNPSGSNSYAFTVQVTNGTYTQSEPVTVNVLDNSPPTVPTTGMQRFDFGTYYEWMLSFNSTDPHNLNLTYSLVSYVSHSGMRYNSFGVHYGNYLVEQSNPGTISNATDTLTVSVADSQGLTTTESYLYNPYQGGIPSPEGLPHSTSQTAVSSASVSAPHSDLLVARMLDAISSFTSTSSGLALDHTGSLALHEMSAGLLAAEHHTTPR